MARINRISITLCALLFTTLPFTPMAHASKQARVTPTNSHTIKTVDKKKSATTSQKTTKTSKKTATKTTSKTSTKTASSSKKRTATPAKSTKTANRRGKTAVA
ncbi:endopeptidase, partial [Citrobacter freundii]